MATDHITKAAALYLLQRGLITCAEVARLAGCSRQVARLWASQYPDSRETVARKLWQKALTRARRSHNK